MDHSLLETLAVVTEEEQELLEGREQIDRTLYYQQDAHPSSDKIDASVVLGNGKLIDMRPHTRFVHFPEHTHDYVEFVYMYHGTTTHVIDGTRVFLKEGDLLFMNQHAVQEILPAGKDDIAVNFMILPQFFDSVLRTMDPEENSLRRFLISCLTEKNNGVNYLYFDAAGILPIQNLMENMIWIMLYEPVNRRTQSQATMALLFLMLTGYTDKIHVSDSYEQNLMLQLLGYIDTHYKDASLASFSAEHGIDIYTMSRLIKRSTGRTFKSLLVEKRMNQAVYLLKNTKLAVTDIAYSVGYENTSYFHRIFREQTGTSPRLYRRDN